MTLKPMPSEGEEAAPPTVAAVVVNHDAGASLGTFLATLRAENVDDVIVVDNASSDGSSDGVDDDPTVRVVHTGENRGYGAGANRGLAATDAELVVVSNPDVVVHHGAVAALAAAFAADPTLAIAGPRILEADGSLYPSARRFPSMTVAAGHVLLGMLSPGNRFSRRYRMADLDAPPTSAGGLSPTVAVDWVSGACFMARHRALRELGGFDESYFMYVEDVDLCWRAHRAGWAVAYVPAATVTHLQGQSTAHRPYRMLLAHHRSALHFAARRTEGWRRITLPAVVVALGARLLVACARQALGTRHKNERQGD
ncbi:MAG TPA: glycosyltransferase family 2 protein [Acidimicrobiales bacterium]|nr:glycosyltransferase family 2 protein [Acidimicrobiales bacterium]